MSLYFLFNKDRSSANYGELRPVIIDETFTDGWVGRHALQAETASIVRHASWSKSTWTMEGRPNNDRLTFLAITLRERAVAIRAMHEPTLTGEEWAILHHAIDFVDETPRPDMTKASDQDIIEYLNTMNEVRSSLENVRFSARIRADAQGV